MKLTLRAPVMICPNLMAGVQIGDGYVTIEYSNRHGSEHRTRYRYVILAPGIEDVEGDDLQSGNHRADLRGGLESLLDFLGAFAEASRPGREKYKGDNSDLFPKRLAEWAYRHSDELALARLEVEENKNCIEESNE